MALNYLLSPEFQISVTSGRPDTGGWVETYLAGTRTKYFTSCDFNGTKNPFRVPLDSLGQALILADVGSSYDVYVYNRYGTLLFSRYNVTPQDSGAISTANITSTDGSITVTQTEHGVDLSVNGHEASVLRATATTLTSDGRFTFTRRQKTGDAVDVGQQGNILAKQGWFHFDVTVKYRWNSVLSNQSVPVTLSTNVGNSVGVFDLSYAHDVTDTLSGEWHSSSDNTEFHVDISGIPQGMTAEVVDFGIHAINGGGSGSGGSGGSTYTGIDGIIVDNDNDEIKPDFDVLQHKLTEGSNIDITDNVISAEVPTRVSELNNDVGYITSADLPVTDVTVDGTSVVVNGVAEITMPTPPTIPVTDVTVDGSSVVHDGVAEIPSVDQQYSASSTNAQSGTAVAEALSSISVDEVPPVTSSDDGKVLTADYYQGVGSYSWKNPQNQVPSRTPSDYGKVLTVTSVGGLSWEAYGESGSLDPGVLSLGNFIVRLRFGDTSYDPLSQSYASSFDSITRVSDGVFDFVFDTNRKNMRRVFLDTFTDITNNPVDILYIRGWNTDYTGPYMREMFMGCTGLRSIWNMSGLNAIKNPYNSLDYGDTALLSMFQDCTNLQEVHCFDVAGQGTGIIEVGRYCRADSIFSGCTSLRIANVHIVGHGNYVANDGTSASMVNGFNECKSLTAPPVITGTWSNISACFAHCESLERFDRTPLRTEHPVQVYGGIGGEPSGLNARQMFYGCYNLKSILPMQIVGPVSNIEEMFTYCPVLEEAPIMKLAQGCNAYSAFCQCYTITETPELDYTKIQNAEKMFYRCENLRRIGQRVQGLATSATTVNDLFRNCSSVVDGTLDCYNALSQSSTIQSHTNTFSGTGGATDFYQGASIPTSWGGDAT